MTNAVAHTLRHGWTSRALAALAVLLALGAGLTACLPGGGNSSTQMPAVGDAAPALTLAAMADGKEVSFPASFRGRAVMLSFFSLG